MAYSIVVDGEFLLEWYKQIGKPQVGYITYVPQFEPLIWGVEVWYTNLTSQLFTFMFSFKNI